MWSRAGTHNRFPAGLYSSTPCTVTFHTKIRHGYNCVGVRSGGVRTRGTPRFEDQLPKLPGRAPPGAWECTCGAARPWARLSPRPGSPLRRRAEGPRGAM